MRNLALALLFLTASAAHAADLAAEEPPADTPELGETDFGPLVEIEKIVVVGNDTTNEKLILRALLVAPGDQLPTADPRFPARPSRAPAPGFARGAHLQLAKGSQRGGAAPPARVVERETLVLNRLDLGTSDETQLWLGIDIGATNLFGSGIAVSAAAVYATAPQLPGGTPQLGLRLRVADQGIGRTPLGVPGTRLHDDPNEPA